MNFKKIIEERESCRRYDPNVQVPPQILQEIAEAGRLAPSACNLQPWKFLFISSAESLSKVKESYGSRWVDNAPHFLVVAGKRSSAWVRSDGYNSLETDLTIAMDHMILAAESLGIGTCWIAAFDEAKLHMALNLTEDEKVFAITPLGYLPAGCKKNANKTRKPLKEIAFFI
ncbi:MAG: nitroreductase family protein [Spirochaetia bacterium]|nr:nitroreductase family protein [Spirochaetia bacterium]